MVQSQIQFISASQSIVLELKVADPVQQLKALKRPPKIPRFRAQHAGAAIISIPAQEPLLYLNLSPCAKHLIVASLWSTFLLASRPATTQSCKSDVLTRFLKIPRMHVMQQEYLAWWFLEGCCMKRAGLLSPLLPH